MRLRCGGRSAACLAGLLAITCRSSDPSGKTDGARSPLVPRSSSAAAPQAAPKRASGAAGPLADAIQGRGWQDLKIDAECGLDQAYRRVAVFGTGVGIWKGAVQFKVAHAEIVALLLAFQKADFIPAPEAGAPRGASASPGAHARPDPLTIVCRVKLAIGPASREVTETNRTPQDPVLRRLAQEIFDVCEPLAGKGLGAADLGDGLRKLADGRLSAETFELLLHRKPETPNRGDGFLLRIEGRAVSARRFTGAAGYDPARSLELTQAELMGLARVLVEKGVDASPLNLHATDYTDFQVAVLDRKKSVQARRFAGLTAQTHGERQRRFDEVLAALTALYQRTQEHGARAGSRPRQAHSAGS
jgi:hypothetical protein